MVNFLIKSVMKCFAFTLRSCDKVKIIQTYIITVRGQTRHNSSMASRKNRKNTIPDRWENYNPLGKKIEGTRFITFKVPLKESLCSKLTQGKFTPCDLMEKCKEIGHTLGGVIDLTFTKRYYSPTEFTNNDVEHFKIFTQGHVVPSEDVRKKFATVVDSFLEKNAANDKVIGVHCTHGVNRTGYLVCRYMVDRLSIDPETAINAYNTARGYDIERENYLEDLLIGEKISNEEYAEFKKANPAENFASKEDEGNFAHPSGSRHQEDRFRPEHRHQPNTPRGGYRQSRQFSSSSFSHGRDMGSNRDVNSYDYDESYEQFEGYGLGYGANNFGYYDDQFNGYESRNSNRQKGYKRNSRGQGNFSQDFSQDPSPGRFGDIRTYDSPYQPRNFYSRSPPNQYNNPNFVSTNGSRGSKGGYRGYDRNYSRRGGSRTNYNSYGSGGNNSPPKDNYGSFGRRYDDY